MVPANLRVPFFWAEFNPGVAPYVAVSRLLLLGQKTAGGSATAGVAIGPLQDNEDGLFGPGSMMARMVKIARLNAPLQEIWALPIADAAGTAASGTIDVSAAPTVNGELNVYIAGRRVLTLDQAREQAQEHDSPGEGLGDDPRQPGTQDGRHDPAIADACRDCL